MKEKIELEIKAFDSTKDFEKWLKKEHAKSPGIKLKLAKKDSGIKSINYQEALQIALCYGWIDGQTNKFDEKYWTIRFTPRGPKSMWSKRNRDIVAELIASGRMQSAGLEKIEAAKKDGRWEMAYDSPKNMKIPADFLKELNKNKKAKTFFETLNKSNLYAIGYRLQTAKKPETRQKRLKQILEMLAGGHFY